MPTVSKNLSLSALTFIMKMYAGSIIFMVLSKYIDVVGFGLLMFGYSLATLVAPCAEFGYSLMALKDIPQNKYDLNKYINSSLIQKGIISIIILVFCFIYLVLFHSSENIRIGIVFMAYAIVLSFSSYFFSVFKAINLFKYETYAVGINCIGLTFILLLTMYESIDILTIASLMLGVRFAQLIYLLGKSTHSFKPAGIKKYFDKEIYKYLYQHSWSYGAHYIIGTLYFTIDTQIISIYLDNVSVALYQSVFRILLVFLILGDILTQVLLPFLSKRFTSNLNQAPLYRGIILVLTILGCSIFLFFSFFSEYLLNFIYSEEYTKAAYITLPLALVAFLRIFGTLYGILLTVSDNQVVRLKVVAISLVCNVILNMLMIAQYGIMGAALASFFTHIVLIASYMYYTKSKFGSTFLSGETFIILLLCGGTYLGSYLLKEQLSSTILYPVLFLLWLLLASGTLFISSRHKALTEVLKETA